MTALISELRHVARRLARTPTLVVATVGTLALTIGAAVAAWAVVDRVILRPLPFPDPEQLVWLDHAAPGIGAERGLDLAPGLYQVYRRQSRSLATIAAYVTRDVNVRASGAPERVEITQATASLAPTLGVAAVHGRFFGEEDDRPGAPPVVVLSDGWWRRAFGGDPSAVGRTVDVDDVRHLIVGVMPPGFGYPGVETQGWIPLGLDPAATSLGSFSLRGVGRLRPGERVAGATRDLQALVPRVAEWYPEAAGVVRQARLAPRVEPLKTHLVGDVQRILWILLGAVGVVFLVAAANLTGLFWVRAESRQRDVAVRVALGAGRGTIFRHGLAESLLLCLVGGGLGIVLGAWVLRLLVASSAAALPRRTEIALDVRVALIAAALAALVVVLLALPYVRQRPRLARVLRESGRGMTSGRQRLRGRSTLVVAQVALAVVLMIGAGLLVRSFRAVLRVDPGFAPEQLLSFELGLPEASYPDAARAIVVQRAILERIGALPGVAAAAATSCLPFCDRWAGDAWRADDRPLPPDASPPIAAVRVVSPGFIETMRIPLLAGRPLTADDAQSASGAVVISAQLAQRLWGSEGAIGRRISSDPPGAEPRWFTVVGVVANTPIRSATEEPAPMVYLPLGGVTTFHPLRLAVVVRARGAPEALVGAIRGAVAAIDPAVPVARVRTLTDTVAGASARLAMATTLLAGAATVALVLGLLGIYGVIAFVVSRRLPEFGLRLALGASPADVMALLLRQGGRLVSLGLGLGVLGALGLTRVLRALLYQVAPADPATFVVATILLALGAFTAIWVPARRAARVDPSSLLRNE